MPARPKTSDEEIVLATLDLVEQKGCDGFSMNDVAAAVGVRAPSLYRHFRDRASLLAAVEFPVVALVADLFEQAFMEGDAEASLLAQAQALRRFARSRPNLYTLIFDVRSDQTEQWIAARRNALAPMMMSLAALAGCDGAFGAARVLVPYLHGFISMESSKVFQADSGIEEAFERGVAVILQGVKQTFRH